MPVTKLVVKMHFRFQSKSLKSFTSRKVNINFGRRHPRTVYSQQQCTIALRAYNISHLEEVARERHPRPLGDHHHVAKVAAEDGRVVDRQHPDLEEVSLS